MNSTSVQNKPDTQNYSTNTRYLHSREFKSAAITESCTDSPSSFSDY